MDLLATLKTRIELLPQGAHTKGLKSVLLHIEAAYRHLARAEKDSDDSAYTDTIYRCNQAFEGGIKEAYRVLAEADPAKLTPFEIEQHLEQKEVFRGRVLSLFNNYRKDWRNPSTHDYTLDFDEAEAFLAIISISGFTKLLIDQISRTIANQEILDISSSKKQHVPQEFKSWNAVSQAAYVAKMFCDAEGTPSLSDSDFSLELARSISLNIKDSDVEIEPQLSADRRYRPDLLLRVSGDAVPIEIKRGFSDAVFDQALWQLENYTTALKTRSGLLICRSPKQGLSYEFIGFDLDSNSVAVAVAPPGHSYGPTTLPAVLLDPR